MNMKGKTTALMISWKRSLSTLGLWRRGKGDRSMVLDSHVVLTKIKLFNNFNETLLIAEDSVFTRSVASVPEQDNLDPSKASRVHSYFEDKHRVESGSAYLHTSATFSDSQLSTLYNFETEDSGVKLRSGSNSPSTPTGSEKSFVVHSRESSRDSCNLDSDCTSSPNALITNNQKPTVKNVKCLDNSTITPVDTQQNLFTSRQEFEPTSVTLKIYQNEASGFRETSEQCGEIIYFNENSSKSTKLKENYLTTQCEDNSFKDTKTDFIRSDTTDSLEDYMDKCCKLSERSNPLGSGLGYLENICQLFVKIGHLQEINLRLQRQVCCLQKDNTMAKTKEEFFQQHCSCGAAILFFPKGQSKSVFLSPTFSDPSTIAEVSSHPPMSAKKGRSTKDFPAISEWRRSQNRNYYTERELRVHEDGTEGGGPLQGRISEKNTWSRVKDLVRKTKVKGQSKLGLTSTSLKMSCPELYRSKRASTR